MKAEVVLINRIILNDISDTNELWRARRASVIPYMGSVLSATQVGFPVCVLALCAGRHVTDFSSGSSPLIITKLVNRMK